MREIPVPEPKPVAKVKVISPEKPKEEVKEVKKGKKYGGKGTPGGPVVLNENDKKNV